MTRDDRRAAAKPLAKALQDMQRGAVRANPAALRRRAALRRAVDGRFGTHPEADGELLRMLPLPKTQDGELPPLDRWLERSLDDASLIAGLVAATGIPVRIRETSQDPRRSSLGRGLRGLLKTRPERSVDSLLTALLRADRERLARPLRRALTLMADDELPLDVAALFEDLGFWDRDNRTVQRRWAYHFWATAPTDEHHDGEEAA